MSISAAHALYTNRLIDATSPYLLQHAHNPVDWYPWGAEAREKARAEDKPIFLSIGYSACHWCHVMERESFENGQIAEILNREYVSIKVDREERPDLDEIYMTATVLYNQGQGGWPMSVFLTPQGKPFYAGTYFPPESRWGRPGFKDVLIQIARLWREQRQRLVESADTLTAAIRTYGGPSADANGIPHDLVSVTARSLAQAFDPLEGGTLSGQTNKFPPSMAMTLMLREFHRTRSIGKPDQVLLDRVETTLDKMAAGGIYDHLGGGIARYSTDPQWLVPHFEKMLYDQALVSAVYIEAWQVTGRERYAEVARDIFDYVLADLQSLEGGFFSSRDADSEGVEGKYYVWSKSEITNVLGERAGELFCSYYDVTEEGNWEGCNILHVPRSLETVAKLNRIDPEELKRILDDSRGKLRGIRTQRVPPGLDDKILTSWNGLMIASLAYGGRALGERRYVDAAARAAEFVLTRMTADGRLLRTCRNGKAHTPGYLDDYAFFVEALLELYFATFEPRWLLETIRLNEETLAHFWDEKDGAFFLTADDAEMLVVRSKDIQDGATPAGNSVALMNLVRLAEIRDSADLRDRAVRTMQALAGSVHQSPSAFTRLLLAVDLARATGGWSAGEDSGSGATGGWSAGEDSGSGATGGLSASAKTRADKLPVAHAHLPATQVVIVGPLDDPATRGLIQTASQGYDPYRMTLLADATVPDDHALRGRVPLLEGKIPIQGRPAAYVCRNRTCGKPARSPEELRDALSIKG